MTDCSKPADARLYSWGVHIRQNDFKDFYEGKYFVQVEKYRETIARFKELVPDPQKVAVVLCSDDELVLSHFKTNEPNVVQPRGSVVQDMYSLSQCDYLIGPQTTTMSTWVAYYGKKPIYQLVPNQFINSLKDFRYINRLHPFYTNQE